jgi:DNA (cytosine-5)-methyltransferase 1
MEEKIKLFDAFAGYGGAHFGLKKAGIPFQPVGFSEIDKFAIQTYLKNHPNCVNYGDITKIDPEDLPDFDIFTGGFPCQPFSSAGLCLGENETRGTLFHDIIRICRSKKPKYVLLENVKGFLSSRHKSTRETIIKKLTEIGYNVEMILLNSKHYGIPQNRERVWIYGSTDEANPFFSIEPERSPEIPRLIDFLDKEPDLSLYKNTTQIDRIIELHKVDLDVPEPCCLDIYNKKVREDGICITITEPHHNCMRIVEPKVDGEYRLRKLSIAEHFRLMGFGENEIDYTGLSYQQACKLAANGWDVNIASKIFKKIFNSPT